MHHRILLLSATLGALLAGCGGTNSPTSTTAAGDARGTLIDTPPPRLASLDAATFAAELGASSSGQQLLQVAGTPACGVDFYYFSYWTVGAKGETATATGALMVPTGAAPTCSGPRPIVLYAHGTQADKLANIADITNPANTEGALIAAVFAAQGYIVVAPNYAGYDTSSLPYHPFLDADQQSKDMIDALTAARTALPHTFAAATSDSGKLFVTGYSQGGYVAAATQRALQAAGQAVTAFAPMSGPYALEAYGDAIFYGSVNIGSTEFTPLIVTSYQEEYGNIYSQPTDIYTSTYAAGAVDILPSATPLDTLFSEGALPESALFDSSTPTASEYPQLPGALIAALAVPSNPVFALGFGEPNLVTNDYRVSYALDAAQNPDGAVGAAGVTLTGGVPLSANAPANTLRAALKANDLRDWTPDGNTANLVPASPVLLCGGDEDPTVFFFNTQILQAYWNALLTQAYGSPLPAQLQQLITVVDVNAAPTANDPFAAAQQGFQTTLAGIQAEGGETAVLENYHTTVAPFCTVVARAFFSQF
ncbi:MAG TPA: prolyl oligopeptidase family serine peptidase [Steroidobacteraceae bacterium]|nr:prolyl oligopeptidase family serine peptidase [Steroidobacteraceae bacterium]